MAAVRRLDGQILTQNDENEQIHVNQIQERHFLRKRKTCGTLHNLDKGLQHLIKSPQYAGLVHIPISFKDVRNPQPKLK
jgi:hypothetical protein